MSRFVFFTKTLWNELPRLRHQLAHLLLAEGHDVVFALKPHHPGQARVSSSSTLTGLRFLEHGELLHHKLRVSRLTREANARWTTRSIVRAMAGLQGDDSDVIVNFNYDYYFLRELFPRNLLITIINDDFVSSAPAFAQGSLRTALRLTCDVSDRVLVTSTVLQEELAFCKPELFLPWADRGYQRPVQGATRDTLLFWGSINRRVDFAFLDRLGSMLQTEHPDWRVAMVGRVEGTEAKVRSLAARPNITFAHPTPLEDLPLGRMFGGLIPFRAGVRDIDAIVMPNKVPRLLARGLPLLITGMPHFMKADFVFRLDDRDVSPTLRAAHESFDGVQPAIRSFVSANDGSARLGQFMGVVRSLRPALQPA